MSYEEMLQKLNEEFNNCVKLTCFVPTTEERVFGGMEKANVFTIDNVIVCAPSLGYEACRSAIKDYITNK